MRTPVQIAMMSNRSYRLALAALLSCAAVLILAPLAAAAGSGSISGTVTEAAAPHHDMSDVEVTAWDSRGEFGEFAGSARTNALGQYRVERLRPGSYKVEFSPPFESGLNFAPQYWDGKSSFAEAEETVIATEGQEKTDIDAELREGGTIAGKVTNADAQPVEDAIVDVYNERGQLEEFVRGATTNVNGEYTVAGLAEGTYKVGIYPPFATNLVPQFFANEPSFADATRVAVEVEKRTDINVTLQVGGEISGRVTDAVTHNPVAGVSVFASNVAGATLFGGFGFTNANGEYTIVGLGTGTYNLEISGESEGGTEYIEQIDNGVSVTQGSTTSGINVSLVPQAPNNTSAPVASGTPAVGQTLSCSNGSWSGISTIGYSYKWLRDGSAIEGATASSYVVQPADQGHGLSCEVTATNSKGHSSAKSNTLSGPAAMPPPPPLPVPLVALASTRVLVTGDTARVPIHCAAATCTGTIELVKQIVVKHRKGHRTIVRKVTIVLGQASYTLASGQTRLLVVHLNKSGAHRLYATKHHELAGVLVVSVKGGSPLRQSVLVSVVAAIKRKGHH
jgi:5-hydroxyisourate hydrolase-like protein (transthyretin family)